MTTAAEMEIGDGLIGALVGALFGAGGLGGMLTWAGKRGETNMKIVGQYYGELSARLSSLEQTVLSQQEVIGVLRSENAVLKSENKYLHAERAQDRVEMDVLRTRLDHLVDLSEVSE